MKFNAFAELPGRKHDTFKTFKGSLTDKISGEFLVSWMDKEMKNSNNSHKVFLYVLCLTFN